MREICACFMLEIQRRMEMEMKVRWGVVALFGTSFGGGVEGWDRGD